MEIVTPGSPITRRLRGPLVGVLAVLLVFAGFLLGRRSSSPEVGGTEVRAEDKEADTRHGDSDGDRREEGIIRFTPLALSRAGVHVTRVRLSAVRADLPVTGTVEPNIAGLVKVTPRVAGKISSLRASIGDTVRAGQVLATMTSTELGAAQAQYRQALARVAATRANLRRQRQLAGFGEFGQHKVQEARGSFNAAQGDVHEAQAEINAARHEVAEAQSALAAARSEEASAESDVLAARTTVTQAKTQVEVSQSRFNRQAILLNEELTSRQEYEQAEADFKKAQADVEAAEAAVRSAQAKAAAAHAKAQQAAAEIDTQRARLEQAQARLKAAAQRLEIAREALGREEKIYKSGVLTSKEVAEAEAALRQAELERSAADSAVRLLGGVPGGGSTLAILAPLAGRVTERGVTAGETVSPEKPLFTIVNLKSVWVQLNVYQRDLSALRIGLPVSITMDAVSGKQFSGSVAYIGDVVDEMTRTVKVRCVIPNPSGMLKPDMFVRGRITTVSKTQGITVPDEAVQTLEGKRVVFVPREQEGEFEPREVETGATHDGRIVIASGLSPGERVVSEGAFQVKAQSMKGELVEE